MKDSPAARRSAARPRAAAGRRAVRRHRADAAAAELVVPDAERDGHEAARDPQRADLQEVAARALNASPVVFFLQYYTGDC